MYRIGAASLHAGRQALLERSALQHWHAVSWRGAAQHGVDEKATAGVRRIRESAVQPERFGSNGHICTMVLHRLYARGCGSLSLN